MGRLLRANFARLWKNRVFYLCLIAMAGMGVYFPLESFLSEGGGDVLLASEQMIFAYVPMIVPVASIFSALFVGTEYSDGTIRNKILVGHRREEIYLSNLLVCIAASFLLCVAYLAPFLCVALPLMGFFTCGIMPILFMMLTSLVTIACFVALFVAVAQLVQGKAYSVVLCILVAGGLLFAGLYVESALSQPEFFQSVTLSDGVITQTAPEPNPDYPTGARREALEFLLDFLPGGQAIQLASMEAENLWQMAVYDLLILLAFTGGGVLLFRKKDIK